MKIAIASDLHLEFGDIEILNEDNADILILAGDITVAAYLDLSQTHLTSGQRKIASNTINFFKSVTHNFKHVIYVMGNHEHYSGDFAKTLSLLKNNLNLPNLHILEKSSVEIDGYVFIGGTMWTDANNSDPQSMSRIKNTMSDFRAIKNSNMLSHRWVTTPKYIDGVVQKNSDGTILNIRKSINFIPKLSVNDTVNEFYIFKDYLESTLNTCKDKKIVVVTHHSPSRSTINSVYAHNYMLNGAYSSNLDFLIEDSPQIVLWVCGHTHHEFDNYVGSTRLVINPRGYIGHEPQAKEFKLKTFVV